MSIRTEQVDTDPPRWMGFFTTALNGERPCMHRHHTEHAATACADSRARALGRAERYAR